MYTPACAIDTNVFVAAGFRSESASAAIIGAVDDGDLRLVWNPAVRDETIRVVEQIPPLDASEVRGLFGTDGKFDAPTYPGRFEAVPDPTDRKFAALAESAAVVVVSSDSDLLEVRTELSVTVASPSEFVDRCGVFGDPANR